MAGHNKASGRYARHPILFRGLIMCEHCGCTVTGDIKKQKYIYYSCNNSKRTCQKIWVREEQLLTPLSGYLDQIQLPDAAIEEIVT
ncbi:zinc ribbon domain-containing protein [Neochlamydia sp. EPS4]|uniref:zinc ribbon domain-containing protein n=1 Tax=Neochlamydia sp. EPS4 TaxID=1478175 RepID=UPI0005D117AB|nr:zinc ribbon domain-containing protein [Neochlamydia sp. EPS4]